MGLFDVNRPGGGMSPLALAVFGAIAYKALKGKGGIGSLLGGGQGAASPSGTSAQPGAGSGTPGAESATAGATAGTGLAGMLGGLGGGGLGSGLRELLDRFRQTGHEEQAQSWVSTGANRPIAPNELESVLGSERIQWLMQQTGLPREQLLAGLSKELPGAIDKLTPNGQVPSDEELGRQIH